MDFQDLLVQNGGLEGA